ncbi:MAG: class I SAM-dependent methyltransferase [Sulfitobacter sp.]
MTRLDLFIARMVSQRACIDHAVALTAHMQGPVFELGLGNGRTFDHIRAKVKKRDIYVFERAVASNPASTPTEDQLVLGDVFETLPMMLAKHGPIVSFAHADLGGHNLEKNDEFARAISPAIETVMAPGGIMVASDAMYFDRLVELPLPEGAVEGRTFIYQCPL